MPLEWPLEWLHQGRDEPILGAYPFGDLRGSEAVLRTRLPGDRALNKGPAGEIRRGLSLYGASDRVRPTRPIYRTGGSSHFG